MPNRNHTILYYLALGIVLLCVSCNSRTIYSHYAHTPLQGWEKNDSMRYGMTIPLDGHYQETIGVRINNQYPFMGLTIIIDQTVFPSLETHCDTLNCDLVGEDGHMKGQGVNHYQYEFPLKSIALHQGDSVSIRIHHTMKREILPGISDIGVTLKRE